MEISLSKNELGEDTTYQCDGFVTFEGDPSNMGHYVAYFLKERAWWKADDQKVQKVSQVETEKALEAHQATIHYQKVQA